jgi:uncharacterized caspase-like protein
MRAVGAILWAILATWVFSQPAFAERRVALVVGNSAYQKVSRLANPTNDSEAMSAILKQAGFDVVELKRDLNVSGMRRALRDFSDNVRDADIAIVYFAGHGIEINGNNYLIPIDAVLERDIDAFDEAIPLDRILTVIEPARQLRLVILDACRDNPFNKTMKRTIGSRAVGRGLAKVEPESPNTLIAFAAKAGSTASDGDGKYSPFTAALVRYLPRPGLDLRKAFGFARDDVLKATNNKQEPFIYGSLGGDDVALVPAVAAPPPAASVADPNAAVRRDYELSERVGTREAWDNFLSIYPDGFYAKLAQAQRNKLAAEEARVLATEKARLAAGEQERLVAEGAKTGDLAKAAEQAKSAEQARLAAEKKKAAEDAKVAEAERAKAGEDARLAAEKAKKTEEEKANQERIAAEMKKAQEEAKAAEVDRAKAAEQAKAEENGRIAAARAKALEEAKAAEQARAAEKQKALDDTKAAEAERVKWAAQVKAEADAKLAAAQTEAPKQKAPDDKSVGQLAALTPPDQAGEALPKSDRPVASDIPRLLLTELRRVGCSTGAVGDNWNAAAQKSLSLFNKNAGTKLDVKVASLDALEILRSKPARVCPLICEHGYKADGDNCTKIVCKVGYEVSDHNTCERIESKKPGAPVVKLAPTANPEAEKPSIPRHPHVSGWWGECSYEKCLAGCQRDGRGICMAICENTVKKQQAANNCK